MNLNILNNFSSKNYYNYPFPHFIIENALSEKSYLQLKKEYETLIYYLKQKNDYTQNNIRIQISSEEFKNQNFDCPNWSKFIDYHNSSKFWREIVSIFSDEIKKNEPKLYYDLKSNEENILEINLIGIVLILYELSTRINTHVSK